MRRSEEHELTEARCITSMLFTMTRHVSAHKANWANDIWVASSFQKMQLEFKFTVMWYYQVNSSLVSGMLLSLTKCIIVIFRYDTIKDLHLSIIINNLTLYWAIKNILVWNFLYLNWLQKMGLAVSWWFKLCFSPIPV